MSAQAITFATFSSPSLPTLLPEPQWKDLSDEELITIYRENRGSRAREDAAAELFVRHQARVARWCCRFTRDRESASDLAQEILLRAFRNLDNYRGECRFSTWLYVIARNLCMSAIQKRSNEPVWVVKANGIDFPDTAAVDVHTAVETEQSRRRSWRFILETLDKTEARVMMLHYGQEMPLNAVSRALGLTNKSGAKAYIVSARRKLAAAMSRDAMRKPAAQEEGRFKPAA
jgi:RNA polymerase sigma-70 factor (ECF subfamily)